MFPRGDGLALKLYFDRPDLESIARELSAMQIARAAGIRVPEPGPTVTIDGRVGFVMGRCDGINGMAKIYGDLDSIADAAKECARLQAKTHQVDGHGLEPCKSVLAERLTRLPRVSTSDRNSLLKLLASMSDGNALLHGDFHPGNIIYSETSEPVIIDWPDATCGDPVADVARSLVIFGEGATDDERSAIERRFREAYLDEYIRVSGNHCATLPQWRLLHQAVRLGEFVAEDESWLYRCVTEGVQALG